MAEHSVRFTVPFRDLGRADVIFKVYADTGEGEGLLGTLLVSHGAIEWRSHRKQKKVKKNWSDFDRLMAKASQKR